MRKNEFLAKLLKETNNEQLVADYEDFIDGRVADGENEEYVIASYNIKQIARQNELEQRKKGAQSNNHKSESHGEGLPVQNVNVSVNVNSGRNEDEREQPRRRSATQYVQSVKGNPRIWCIVSFVVAAVCMVLIGYFTSELVEVLSGYYDHMDRGYVRSEIIGYSISLFFSVVVFIVSLVFGFVFLRKHKKINNVEAM